MKSAITAAILFVLLVSLWGISVSAEDLGRLSANRFDPESTSNPYGAGSPVPTDMEVSTIHMDRTAVLSVPDQLTTLTQPMLRSSMTAKGTTGDD